MHVKNHDVDYFAYMHDVRTPYSQSLNFSVSTNLTNNMTVDVRYSGTLARKGIGSININTPNFINNGLLDALNAARRGDDDVEMFDKIFTGLQFQEIYSLSGGPNASHPVVNGPGPGNVPTGADVIRKMYTTQLATGNYAEIAMALADLNYDKVITRDAIYGYYYDEIINQGLPDLGPDERGAVLRYANTQYPGEFPENFILGNPQLKRAEIRDNLIHSNYHGLQVQTMIRPTRGITFRSTYTYAKNLADQPGGSGYWGGGDWTDPTHREYDYRLSYTRKHQWNTYGYFDLPFGPNGFFFRNVQNDIVRRAIEGWQLSFALSLQSGEPQQFNSGNSSLYAIDSPGLMDLVPGMEEYAPGKRNVSYYSGSSVGYAYGTGGTALYAVDDDPQCSNPALVQQSVDTLNTNLSTQCASSLDALFLGNVLNPNLAGQPVLVQPLPGNRGTFANYVENVGTFTLDGAMGKDLRLAEGKSINFRMDVRNILNHPQPSNASYTIGNNFGQARRPYERSRTFQGKVTLRY
jgi:hypothetical protein